MSGGYDPLGLPITPAFYEFLVGTDAGHAVVTGAATDSYDEHLIRALHKVVQTPAAGSRQVRRIKHMTIPELDALAPYAQRLRELPSSTGRAHQGARWLAGNAACKTIEHLREILAARDPSQVSEQRYPLHNRLRVRQNEALTVMALLDWLSSPATTVTLAEPDPVRRGALRPATLSHHDLMLTFLDIDPAALAEEERAMRAAGTVRQAVEREVGSA